SSADREPVRFGSRRRAGPPAPASRSADRARRRAARAPVPSSFRDAPARRDVCRIRSSIARLKPRAPLYPLPGAPLYPLPGALYFRCLALVFHFRGGLEGRSSTRLGRLRGL